jgi:glycosyltransferase involved in cell wall biosynthesis
MKFIYRKSHYPRYNQNYYPNCLLIVPVKGKTKFLENTVYAYLNQNYQNYRIIFVVESKKDLAFYILEEIIQKYSHATICIANRAHNCSQKNWNLIKAIESTDFGEIIIIGDADITQNTYWLKELVMPFSDPTIAATSGFYWIKGRITTAAALCHFLMSLLQLLSLVLHTRYLAGVWGGSTAIRRNEYEALHVKQKWLGSFSDDVSLSRLLFLNKKKTVMVANFLSLANETINNPIDVILWIKKQVMTVKYYWPNAWMASLTVTLLPMLAILLPLFTGFTKLAFLLPWSIEIGMLTIIVFLGTRINKYITIKFNLGFFIKILFASLMLFTGTLLTVFSNKIYWSGIIYKMNKKGVVKEVLHTQE